MENGARSDKRRAALEMRQETEKRQVSVGMSWMDTLPCLNQTDRRSQELLPVVRLSPGAERQRREGHGLPPLVNAAGSVGTGGSGFHCANSLPGTPYCCYSYEGTHVTTTNMVAVLRTESGYLAGRTPAEHCYDQVRATPIHLSPRGTSRCQRRGRSKQKRSLLAVVGVLGGPWSSLSTY